MPITEFSTDVENISKLDDNPYETEGIGDSTDLKACFDKAGKDIKAYINGTLKTFVDGLQDGTKELMIRKELVTIAVADWTTVQSGKSYTARMVEVTYNVYKNKTSSIYFVRPATIGAGFSDEAEWANNAALAADRQFFVCGWTSSSPNYYLDVLCVGAKPTASIKLEIIRVQLSTS